MKNQAIKIPVMMVYEIEGKVNIANRDLPRQGIKFLEKIDFDFQIRWIELERILNVRNISSTCNVRLFSGLDDLVNIMIPFNAKKIELQDVLYDNLFTDSIRHQSLTSLHKTIRILHDDTKGSVPTRYKDKTFPLQVGAAIHYREENGSEKVLVVTDTQSTIFSRIGRCVYNNREVR